MLNVNMIKAYYFCHWRYSYDIYMCDFHVCPAFFYGLVGKKNKQDKTYKTKQKMS